MRATLVFLFTVALLSGCSKPSAESYPSGKNLCPLSGVTVQKSEDGLERAIKAEQDWAGDKYGPIRFTCESSSLERLLTFVVCGPTKEFDEVVGRELLPKGTYQYSFHGKTWDDKTALSSDVLNATGATFGLKLEILHNQQKTILVIKQKQKESPNKAHALDAGLRLCFIRASLARASDARR